MNSTTTCEYYLRADNDSHLEPIIGNIGNGGSSGDIESYNPADGSVTILKSGAVSQSVCVTINTGGSSGSSTVSGGYNGPNLQEVLLMYMPILMIFMLMLWMYIFKGIRKTI